jgi:hypothetical protein
MEHYIYGESSTPGDQGFLVLYRLQYTIVVFRRESSRGHRSKREEEKERKSQLAESGHWFVVTMYDTQWG